MIETHLSVKETANQLGCSAWQVYELYKTGGLSGFRIGKRRGVRVYAKSVVDFVAKNENKPSVVSETKNTSTSKSRCLDLQGDLFRHFRL